jgi:hypothetical protein
MSGLGRVVASAHDFDVFYDRRDGHLLQHVAIDIHAGATSMGSTPTDFRRNAARSVMNGTC